MGINASRDGSEGNQISSDTPIPTKPKAKEEINAPPNISQQPLGNALAVGGPSRASDGRLLLEGDIDSTVPTVFKWEHGGKEVQVDNMNYYACNWFIVYLLL